MNFFGRGDGNSLKNGTPDAEPTASPIQAMSKIPKKASKTPTAPPAVQEMTARRVREEAVKACEVIGTLNVKELLRSVGGVYKVENLPLSRIEPFVTELRKVVGEQVAPLPAWLEAIVPPLEDSDQPGAIASALFKERQRVRKAIREALKSMEQK